jgi:hypothetical protein
MYGRGPNIFDLADNLSGPPSGGREQMWILGGLFAALPTGYGLYCCLTGHAKTINVTLRGIQPVRPGLLLDIFGGAAISFGLTLIFIGTFLHFHWFWCHHRVLSRYYEIGKLISLIGILISAGFYVYLMFL